MRGGGVVWNIELSQIIQWLKKEYEDLYYVEGSYEDVLVKVRDLVYEGVELISHPLWC